MDQIIKRYVCTNISGSKKNKDLEELLPYIYLITIFFSLSENNFESCPMKQWSKWTQFFFRTRLYVLVRQPFRRFGHTNSPNLKTCCILALLKLHITNSNTVLLEHNLFTKIILNATVCLLQRFWFHELPRYISIYQSCIVFPMPSN